MAYDVGAVVGHIRMDTTGWSRPRDAILRDVRNIGLAFTTLATVVTVPIRRILGEYGRFEQAMRSATSVSIVTTEQFRQMSRMAEEASVRWGIAAEETAKAYLFLGRAGLTATQQIQAFSAVTMAAKAMQEDLERTTEGVVNVMNAFAIQFGETQRVVDTMTAVVNGTTLSLNELLVALSYAGKPAKAFNNTIEDTAAMIGLVANEGIRGSKAGTAFRFALTALASPTAEARRILNELNIEIYKSNGVMLPFVDIMAQLEERFRGADEEFRNIILESLYGRRALPAMIALFQQGSEKIRAFSTSLRDAAGLTRITAEKQMVAMTQRAKQAWQEILVLARHIGMALAPRVIEITNNIRNLVAVWVEWIDAHQEVVRNIMETAARLAIAAAKWGILLTVGSILLGVFRQMTSVVVSLASALWGLVKAITGIGTSMFAVQTSALLMLATLYILRVSWVREHDNMKEAITNLADHVKEKYTWIKNFINRTFAVDWFTDKMKEFGEFINKGVTGFAERERKAFGSKSLVGKVGGALDMYYKTVGGTIKSDAKVVGEYWKNEGELWATDIAMTFKKDIGTLKGALMPVLESVYGGMKDKGLGFIKGIDDQINALINKYTGGLLDAVFGSEKEWQARLNRMGDWLQRYIEHPAGKPVFKTPYGAWSLPDILPEQKMRAWKDFGRWLQTEWKSAIDMTKLKLQSFNELLQEVQTSIIDGWTDAFDKLMQRGSSWMDFMTGVFQSVLAAFRRMLAQMLAERMFRAIFGGTGERGGTEAIAPLAGTVFDTIWNLIRGTQPITGGTGWHPDLAPAYNPTLPELPGNITNPIRLGEGTGKIAVSVTNTGAIALTGKAVANQYGRDTVISIVLDEAGNNPAFRDMLKG